MTNRAPTIAEVDAAVMARLRAPFGCEFIQGDEGVDRWRIHDANDDAIASVSGQEKGYARLIVQALNEHFDRRSPGVKAVITLPDNFAEREALPGFATGEGRD